MARRSIRTVLLAGLVGVGLLLPASSVTAGTPSVPFYVSIGVCQMNGYDANVPFSVVHRSKSGAKKGSYTPTFAGFPSTQWTIACTRTVVPGDTLTFLDQTDPENPAVFRTFMVPVITATTDRIRNRVVGVAKGVATIDVSLSECVTSTSCDVIDNGTVAAGGPYLYAPAKDTTAISKVTLIWGKTDVAVFLTAGFPRLAVTLGSAAFSGAGSPGQKATVTIRRAGKNASGARTIGLSRTFKGKAVRNGVSRPLAAGDRVRWYLGTTLQGDFIVPDLSMQIAPSHTSGVCFPNGDVVLTGVKPDKTQSTTKAGVAGPDGAFDIVLGINGGWSVTVACRTAQGDEVRLQGIAGG